ncbi:MAG: hypothetical protein MJZ69_09805 [Bacteroidaceae bacterium]|nr:hypothetical protein [Bacteroidaceae bacterium]
MMKNRLFLLLAFVLFCAGMKAQENMPQHYNIRIGEFTYKKPNLGKNILNIVTSIVDKDTTHEEEKSMLTPTTEALAASPTYIPWLHVVTDDASADYILDGHIEKMETGGGRQTHALVVVQARITDARTGNVVAQKLCRSYYYEYVSGNMADIKAKAIYNITFSVYRFLLEALPVTGSILQQGVEQASGKVKDNQCYVDLGEQHGVLKNSKLYVLDASGKYKAEMKVEEVMGDDMCAAKITSGKSFIEKSLKNGTPMTVTTKPKKIKDE